MHRFSKIFSSDEAAPEELENTENEEEGEEEEEPLSDLSGYWGPNDLRFYGQGSRTIAMNGPINERSSLVYISQLLELVSQAPMEQIHVHLNTPGGSLHDALAMYDTMVMLPTPIVVTVTGQCASGGLLVLAAADVKLSFPNSMFFYHPVQWYHPQVGSKEQNEATHKAYTESMARYMECFREGFGLNQRKWRKHFEDVTMKYFFAGEAKELGLLDDITKPVRIEKHGK
jgi:ATP-dependent Clp protease, protease subunit